MELKDYITPLRRWWWLILASTLVATVASVIATSQQPPIYRSHTTLMVGQAINNPNPSGSDFYLMQQLATTYADIVQREHIRKSVMESLGLSGLPEYTTRVVPNTQLLEITVVDTSPERGQAVANELARQLIMQTPTASGPDQQQREAFVNEQLAQLEESIKSTQAEIQTKQDELSNMFSARQIADAQAQIAGLQGKLNSLQANYASLLSNTGRGAINSLTVIEQAELPVTPVGPNKLLTILLAAVIGFTLAAGAAYLLEYLDDTLKVADDTQKALGLTLLGAIPLIEDLSGGDLIFTHDSKSPAVESYRVLRTNLQFASVDRPVKRLLVTSPGPAEGKTISASNLAAALAQAGNRVVLVDGDLHRPRLHRVFKLVNNAGLTTALLEAHPDPVGLLQDTSIPGLQVLTSGPLPPNPAELLGTARMRELLAVLDEHADTIVIDSPPVTMLSDAAIISTLADGVLLVLMSGQTRREVAKRAVEALRQVNAHVLGVLMNRITPRSGGYYYYKTYYYYKSGYYTGGGDDDKGGSGTRTSRLRRKRRSPSPKPAPAPTQAASSQER